MPEEDSTTNCDEQNGERLDCEAADVWEFSREATFAELMLDPPPLAHVLRRALKRRHSLLVE
jgi:hypothetical protein